MESYFEIDVINWYKQFSHEKSQSDDHTSPNFLTRVTENDIDRFKSEFGDVIPVEYLEFLRIAGDGRIRRDANGMFNEFNENSFLNTTEISDYLRKNSEEWEKYPDFISENEVPFFSVGGDSVLVFRKNEGSKVYFPYLDDVYAENFGEFLKRLMNNANFYNEL